MFRRLPDLVPADTVTIAIDGVPATARAGDSAAAALLANGHAACRETAPSGARRGPWCLMGVCFDCLVTIDDIGNRQGCTTTVREGMRIETRHGRREARR